MNLKERAEKLKIDIPVIGYLDDLIILPALIAIPFVLIWILIICLIVKAIWF